MCNILLTLQLQSKAKDAAFPINGGNKDSLSNQLQKIKEILGEKGRMKNKLGFNQPLWKLCCSV